MCSLPASVPDDLQHAHDTLIAKRRLTTILRCKNFTHHLPKVGDMVQVFVKLEKYKRGGWFSPRDVLSMDAESVVVTVPGAWKCTISAAIENVRPAVVEDDLSFLAQESIDALDDLIEAAMDDVDQSSHVYSVEDPDAVQVTYREMFSFDQLFDGTGGKKEPSISAFVEVF